jgi:hypothetical protein
MSNVSAVLAQFEGMKGAKFASFVYEAKGTGEVARHSVILGAIMENVYRKDIAALEAVLPTLTDAVEILACQEILKSRRESLDRGIGNNSVYMNADTYIHLAGFNGIKVHKEEGTLFVTCLANGKTVLSPGTYKEVKSSDKTIAKRKLMKAHCRGNDIRTYKFTNVLAVRMNGETIEIDGDVEVTR